MNSVRVDNWSAELVIIASNVPSNIFGFCFEEPSENEKILRSVRITHAGSCSYIVLNHVFLHNVSRFARGLPEWKIPGLTVEC